LTTSIQEAARKATPVKEAFFIQERNPNFIKKAIAKKRKLRRIWQNTH